MSSSLKLEGDMGEEARQNIAGYILSSLGWGGKLILFCFCCDETQGKNNIHHFEINQNTKQ